MYNLAKKQLKINVNYLFITACFTESWDDADKLEVTSNRTSVLVKDLHPAYQYQLRVVARNVLGSGPPSLHLTYITSEEGKLKVYKITTVYILKKEDILLL